MHIAAVSELETVTFVAALKKITETFLKILKGTVSRDFFTLFFFIKQLLLFPLDMPRKDFEFF